MDCVNQNPLNTNCPDNNDIIEKAFGIGLVFEKIFEDSKDFKSLMELRLVCQLFNRGCLQIIKNSFQKVQIEVDETKIPEEFDAHLYNQWDHILINGIDLKISTNKELDELLPFIKFLKNEVGVVVKQLRLKGLYKLDKKYYSNIHWAIFNELIGENRERLTELIGIEDICPLGCEHCAKFGDRCKKYGPVQYNALVNGFNKQQHFTELLISDRFLYRIVEHVTDTEKSKEEVMESMKKMIPSITCDHLVITFTETMNSSGDLTVNQKGLPYECLEAIIRSWKPKSIGLEIHAPRGSRITQTNGYRDGYFTELKFDAPIGTLNGFEDLKFSHLEIDLSDSKEYLKVLEIDGRIDGYNNLFSNARRMFPTDKMNVILPKGFMKLSEVVKKNLNFAFAILKGNERNLQVNIQIFAKIPALFRQCGMNSMCILNGRMIDIAFDENHPLQKYQKMVGLNSNNRKTFNNVQFIGKRYTICDNSLNMNNVINVDLWTEKEPFENYCHNLTADIFGSGPFHVGLELMDPVHRETCLICQRL